MATPITCAVCGITFPLDADPRRITCGSTCRARRKRAKDAERLRALFAAQTAAALSGDVATLAEVERQAARLLGIPKERPHAPGTA